MVAARDDLFARVVELDPTIEKLSEDGELVTNEEEALRKRNAWMWGAGGVGIMLLLIGSVFAAMKRRDEDFPVEDELIVRSNVDQGPSDPPGRSHDADSQASELQSDSGTGPTEETHGE